MKLRGFIVLGVVLTIIHVTHSRTCMYYPHGRSSVFADMAQSVNDFSLNLYKAVLNNPTTAETFISAPLSVAMVLLMASFGAEDPTAAEFNRFIHAKTINQCTVRTLTDELRNHTNVELFLANKIFANSGTAIKAAFQEDVEFAYHAMIETLNFTESDDAIKKINEWCKQVTNSRIRDLLKFGDVDDSTVLVLVNAIYFKGSWAQPFEKLPTNYLRFYSANGTSKTVPSMINDKQYRYGALAGIPAKFVVVPYESKVPGDNVSMVIILPDELNGLHKVEENITQISLKTLLSANITRVQITMPIFSIESRIEMTENLELMGMKEIFSNAANFSGISDGNLKISKVVQKAFLDVNENGSEAAAATGGTMVDYIAVEEYQVFTVNRPFLFLIVTGDIIVFCGRVSDVD